MKNKRLTLLFLTALVAVFFPITVSANSSWHWVTTSPLPVLPFVMAATLVIEFYAIKKFCQIKNAFKVFAVVCVANLISFVVPNIFKMYIDNTGGMVYSFTEVFETMPNYIIGLGYLFLTLIIEIPVVYLFFRKDVENKRKLFYVTLCANIATTALVAVVERVVCRGSW